MSTMTRRSLSGISVTLAIGAITLALATSQVQAKTSFSFNFGVPGYYPQPYYGYPVYVGPAYQTCERVFVGYKWVWTERYGKVKKPVYERYCHYE